MFGYTGKVLRVNLSTGSLEVTSFPEETLRRYIGGVGLGARVLYDETTAGTEPLAPENELIFLTGPLTGTPVPTSGRFAVVARSPLTGLWGEADCGGHWGTALKRAGYDGVIVTGAAPEPVYLWISEDRVEVRDASPYWGLDTYALDAKLRAETDLRAVVAAIGPAGERLVKFAAILTDGKDARAAGRCGMGAVMGSKKLKAIAAYGHRQPQIFLEEALRESVRRAIPQMKERARTLHLYGTARGVITAEAIGDLPVKNWYLRAWGAGAEKVSGQEMARTILTKPYFCGSCAIGCGRRVRVDGRYGTADGAGPEYETIGALGSLCLVDDLEAIAVGNELCNRYGMDTISTGGAIAFAMEAYEKGLLAAADLEGVEARWGDPTAMLGLIRLIGERRGFGAVLGEGVRAAARELGPLAEEFTIHVKGLELPMHDPRALGSLAVAYATSNRGACHVQACSHGLEGRIAIPELGYPEPLDRWEDRGKGQMTKVMQDLMGLFDSLKLCKLALFSGAISVTNILEWTNQVTGWDLGLEELMLAGERIFNLRRLYNLRLGASRKDDTLPARILTHTTRNTVGTAYLPHLGLMLGEYYEARGWTETGVPTPAKLSELSL